MREFPGSLAAGLLVLSLLSGGCESRPAPGPAGGPARLPVLTTLSVLADLIRQVGGDQVEVKALVPPGSDVHTFQPTPQDITDVARARIVFMNGAHLDAWLDQTIQSAGRADRTVVVLAHGLPTIVVANEPNPHLWLDVSNARRYVERIRDGLGDVDKPNAAYYADRARAYLSQLDDLDAWIRAQVDSLPKARRKLVTFHDAFPYFARRYGFSIQGVAVSSPGKEPSARELAALVGRIKQERVPAVFAEAQFNPRTLEIVAQEAGVKVITTLYSDSLSSGPEADSYVALMRHNVTRIVEALR